jgi:hypothetical protein
LLTSCAIEDVALESLVPATVTVTVTIEDVALESLVPVTVTATTVSAAECKLQIKSQIKKISESYPHRMDIVRAMVTL